MAKTQKEFENEKFSFNNGELVYYGEVFDLTDPDLKRYAEKTIRLVLKDCVTGIKYNNNLVGKHNAFCGIDSLFIHLNSLVVSSNLRDDPLFSGCSKLRQLIIRGSETDVSSSFESMSAFSSLNVTVPVDYFDINNLSRAYGVIEINMCFDGSRALKFSHNICPKCEICDKKNTAVKRLVFANIIDLHTSMCNGNFACVISGLSKMIRNNILESCFSITFACARVDTDAKEVLKLLNSIYAECKYSIPLFACFMKEFFRPMDAGQLNDLIAHLSELNEILKNNIFKHMLIQIFSIFPCNVHFSLPESIDNISYLSCQHAIRNSIEGISDCTKKIIALKRLTDICRKYIDKCYAATKNQELNSETAVEIFSGFWTELNKLSIWLELCIAKEKLCQGLLASSPSVTK